MKHLTHLIATDARRFAVLLAAWVVVVAASTVLEGVRPAVAIDPRVREALSVIGSLLSLVVLLLTFVVISFVVHAHPTVGTDAFWMTRPVPPGALLAGKLVLLGIVLVVVPALAQFVLMITQRVTASVAAAVVSEFILSQTLFVAILTAGAALTSSLARFALLCGAVLTSVAAAFAVTLAILIARFEETPTESLNVPREDPTGWVVVSVLTIASALTLLALQYRLRWRLVSVTAGVIGLVVAVLGESYWPWRFLVVEPLVPSWATQPSSLVLQLEPGSVYTHSWRGMLGPAPEDWREVRGQVRLSGAAPGWAADIALAAASLQTENEVLTSVPGRRTMVHLSLGSANDYPTRATIRDLLGVTSVGEAAPPQLESPVVFLLRQAEFERHPAARGQYRGRFHVLLTRYEIEGVLPLRSGARHQSDHYSLVLGPIAQAEGRLEIAAREWQATSSWERRPMSLYSYYLRSQRRQEAVAGSAVDATGHATIWRILPFMGNFSFGGSSSPKGFRTLAAVVTLPPRYGLQAETLSVDETWLADAELVIVRRTQEGSVERELIVPDFSFGTAARTAKREQ